jgi:hypothetical protein
MKRIWLLVFIFLYSGINASALSLRVTQESKLDSKGKTNDTKSQTRTLDMTLTSLENGTVKAEVHYWFFSRNMKSGKERILKHGIKTAMLECNTPTKVQSEVVTSDYIEEHVEVEKAKGGKGGGKGKGSKITSKKVSASGDRITGYAVQVVVGTVVAADYYSAPSYKQWGLERGK